MRVGVIVNPSSRKNRVFPDRWRRLARIAVAVDPHARVFRTRDLAELATAMQTLRDAGAEVLLVDGGDGTLSRAVDELCRCETTAPLPLLVPLAGGTNNAVARQLGFGQHNVLGRVRAQLLRVMRGEVVPTARCQLTEVNGRTCFGFAMGFATRGLQWCARAGGATPANAVRLLTRLGLSAAVNGRFAQELLAREPYRVRLDDQTLVDDRFSLIFGGGVREVGMGCRMLYRGTERTGHIHIRGFTLTPLAMVRRVPRIWSGAPLPDDRVLDHVVRRAVLTFDSERSYTLDGELYTARDRIELRAGTQIRVPILPRR